MIMQRNVCGYRANISCSKPRRIFGVVLTYPTLPSPSTAEAVEGEESPERRPQLRCGRSRRAGGVGLNGLRLRSFPLSISGNVIFSDGVILKTTGLH